MDKKARLQELFANGPVGVWVKILGPRNAKVVGAVFVALAAAYFGLRLRLGQ